MKRILCLILLFFLTFPQYAVADNGLDNLTGLEGLGVEVNGGGGTTTTTDPITGKEKKSVPGSLGRFTEEIFCSVAKIGEIERKIDGEVVEVVEIKLDKRYLHKEINKIYIETFANTIGRDIIDKSTEQKVEGKGKVTAKYVASTRLRRGPTYQALEQFCLDYRKESPENNEEVENLLKQVKFFYKYYDYYPEELRRGQVPGFMMLMIEWINKLSLWLVYISVLNILYCGLMYQFNNQKPEYKKRFKNSFLYLLVLWAVNVGILGFIIGMVGFDGLNIVRIFWNF